MFANKGVFKPAQLVRQKQAAQGERVVPASVAGEVLDMLKTVTGDEGTARQADMTTYSAAGKTGTVHKVGENGYADDRYRALFAGMAPASDPRIVTVVMIDEPDLNKYHGGEAAAPVFSRVVADALRILDVVPDKTPSPEQVADGEQGQRSAKDSQGRRTSA